MTQLETTHWRYRFGEPSSIGVVKHLPEDFMVIEKLGYQPCGEGEHIYLWIEKKGLNTAFVAEQLAKFTQLPLRAISYAGRKDKHALTQQWFGVHKPGKHKYDWSQFSLEGCQVLEAIRHNKKLRTGVLKGNEFRLTIRQFVKGPEFESRIDKISEFGVPNYFGQQRFGQLRHGEKGGNLVLAQRMLEGEVIKNRNKRSMVMSALRSWLFNEFVSQRIEQQHFDQPLLGDVMSLSGSNSFFVAEELSEQLNERLARDDISMTSPMWGKGKLHSSLQAAEHEASLAHQHQQVCSTLEKLGLDQERRAIRLVPRNLSWQIDGELLTLSFELPSGCFATSVLRELILEREGDSEHENITE